MRLGKVCVSGSIYRDFVRTELREAGCKLVLGKSDEEFPQTGNRMAVQSIVQLLGGGLPENVLNPDAIPSWRERLARLGVP